jgi:predicted transposase YbfD/YdcC
MTVPDARGDRGKLHVLSEILFLTVVGLLAGAQNAEDISYVGNTHIEWFRRFLVLKRGVPSHDTFLEVLALVKPELIEALVRAWTAALREPGALTVAGNHVAFDGQALRGSADRHAGITAVQMVSAYLTGSGVVLGSKAVDRKSNEIVAIPDLIRSLDLRGATVTIDAMGCQRAIAADLRNAGAHYVLQVKDNQPTLLANAKATAVELVRRRRPSEAPAQKQRHHDVDKGHGRIESRTCILTRDLSAIERPDDWKDVAGIAIVLRERQDVISGKTSRETSYFIVSDPEATAASIAAIIRNHWAIENKLHWSLDVTWGSDSHCVRDRNAAENLARIRRFCDGMVKQSTGWGMSARRVRMGVGWNPDNALKVLAGEVIERERGRRKLDPKRFKSSK